jgi:uncharacterized DUF497 family protein
MKITFDPAKRAWTLRERGLDFEDAAELFAGPTFTFEDDRFDYPEVRFFTLGCSPVGWSSWFGRPIPPRTMIKAGGSFR